VSFVVRPGEIFGVLGPNGAGKTTTVECLAGLRRPDRGRVRVLGMDPERHGSELRQRIGLQLQQAALPERIKVWEALELFASFYRHPLDRPRLLEQWGLEAKRNAAFASLSGGQRQRLFIALALVGDPELVILDELTAGLDPQARRVTWELVAAIRDAGTTVVLVTHLMDEAERLCDRVAIIDEGRIVAQGAPAELVRPLVADAAVRFTATTGFDATWLQEVAGVARVIRDDRQIVIGGIATGKGHIEAGAFEAKLVPGSLTARLRETGARFDFSREEFSPPKGSITFPWRIIASIRVLCALIASLAMFGGSLSTLMLFVMTGADDPAAWRLMTAIFLFSAVLAVLVGLLGRPLRKAAASGDGRTALGWTILLSPPLLVLLLVVS